MKSSNLFIKALENEGVEYIFGIPGEENLDFLESLRKSDKIKLIITRHEQAAGFMAATYGRLTGKTGVCISTLGPGATNLVTAAAYAQLGAMPMLMITGQKPIKKSKQGRFQIIDVIDMMRPLTKFTKQIVSGNTIPSLVREAFRVAEEERPGAVHLELPEDVAKESTTAVLFEKHITRRSSADKKTLTDALSKFYKAKHPLVLIGAAANRNRTHLALHKFLDKTGIPCINTQMGKGVIDECCYKNFLGTAALSDHDYLHFAIKHADLIINIGHDVIEKPPFFMEHGGMEVIHINFFSAHVDDIYFPQIEIIGDISNTIEQLTDLMEIPNSWDFSFFNKLKTEVERHINENSEAGSFPILPQRIVADVQKVLGHDGIVTLDNGIYKIWFARNYKAHFPNSILLDNALAVMGAGLPSAIAAKIVNFNSKVIAIVGDGGFLMNSQELETAVRLNLDLTVIILNDSAFGMIKWKQAQMGFEDFGLNFSNPDFVKYAESYGAHGVRINKTDKLAKTIDHCLNTPGVHVIDVPVNYSENERVLIKELKEKIDLLKQ